MKKALIISVSGIGNTILQGPFIRSVLEDGRFEVDCLFGNQGMAQVFKGYPAMNKAFVLPGSFSNSIYLIAILRKRRYDISLSCFPSNRPQFHLLPFLIRAKKRLIHDYGKFNAAFSFLSNEKIKAQRGIHDVEQNLRLLVPLEIKRGGGVQKRLYFAISDQDEYKAENLLKKWGMKRDILGIHAGSGPLQGKKWPLERFGQVARALIDKGYLQHVLVFGGPEEAAEKKRLQEMIKAGKAGRTNHGIARAVNASLGVTAAVIKRTSFFLSNDSGLMHVAAAVGTQVLGIFGPTDWHRTAPWGNGTTFVRLELIFYTLYAESKVEKWKYKFQKSCKK